MSIYDSLSDKLSFKGFIVAQLNDLVTDFG